MWSKKFSGASSFGAEFAGSGGRATRDSVLDKFVATQSQFEGSAKNFDYMYTDNIGFVTTGMGNKIDDNSPTNRTPGMNGYGPALKLPWIHKSDGQPATQAEIIQDWQTVKAAHTADGTYDAPHDAQITQLKLSQLALQDLIATQLINNEEVGIKDLPNFKDYPADAQMAIHGMWWAMGAGFIPAYHFTAFQAAAVAQNWPAAKAQSGFKGAAPQRKAAHDQMFDNAAKAVANNLNFDMLWYPGVAPDVAPPPPSKLPLILSGAMLVVAAGGAYYYRDDLVPFAKNVARDTVKMTNKWVVDPVVNATKKVVT